MPWEVTIRQADGSPLGDRDDVVRRISAAVPAFAWTEEPPFLERIKEMPDHPFHALIPTWPEEVRASFSRPRLYADVEGDGFSIRLFGFEGTPIGAVHAEVRGDGNPLEVLSALCFANAWVAVDDAIGKSIQLSSGAAAEWEAFRQYRDRAIGIIKSSNDNDRPT
jgi:hypothetical protein